MLPWLVSIYRGLNYTIKVSRLDVWSRLAQKPKAKLDGLQIKDSIGVPIFFCFMSLM
jgi:hypothetical protein